MEPITLEELAAAIDGVLPTPFARGVVFERVTQNADHVSPGDLFWAFSEDRGEIREQVALAESRDAVAIVAPQADIAPGPRRILVPDTRRAVGQFAQWYRSLLDAYVVGVIGSYGKATARRLTNAALGVVSEDADDPRDRDETIRLSRTLLNMSAGDRFAIVRLNSDQRGLAEISRPEAVIITQFDGSNHQPLDELLGALPRGGFAILPGDHPPANSAARHTRATALLVGHESANTHRVSTDRLTPGRLRFRVDRSPFEIAAPGRHFSILAGMAVIAARRLGRRDPEIAKNLEAFEPDAGRGRVTIRRPWTIIDETAGGHADSLGPTIAALAEWPGRGRRILVCGDLTSGYAGLGDHAFEGIDRLATIGTSARQVAHDARKTGMDAPCLAEFSQWEHAADWLRNTLRPDDVVWIKSARAASLARLVADLVRHAEGTRTLPMAA